MSFFKFAVGVPLPHEVNTAAELVQRSADPEANIIFGTIVDERIHDAIMVTVIATGIEENSEPKMIKYNI